MTIVDPEKNRSYCCSSLSEGSATEAKKSLRFRRQLPQASHLSAASSLSDRFKERNFSHIPGVSCHQYSNIRTCIQILYAHNRLYLSPPPPLSLSFVIQNIQAQVIHKTYQSKLTHTQLLAPFRASCSRSSQQHQQTLCPEYSKRAQPGQASPS